MCDRLNLTYECTVCGLVELTVGSQKRILYLVFTVLIYSLKSLLFWKCTVDMLRQK